MIDFHSLKTQKGPVDEKEGCTRYLRKSSRFAWLEGLRWIFFFLSKQAHPDYVGQILFSSVRGKLYVQLKRTGICSRSPKRSILQTNMTTSTRRIPPRGANIKSRGRQFPCHARGLKFHYLCTIPNAPNDPSSNTQALCCIKRPTDS